jgi:ribulose 1,5-bisphosphate carboxylase large subunit-like protein
LGGIVKPKIGVSPKILLEMVKELVEGGVNFIKEDEIMANPPCCPIEERVPLVMDYVKGKNVIYSVCVNSDPTYILNRVKRVYELGGNSVHVNFWAGMGVYKAIRDLDLPIFLHFQKSGDKILTDKSHRFHIDWDVVCKLAGLMGADFIHAGMFGGYMNVTEDELRNTINVLHQYGTMPALSCGMHPGLVNGITKRFGPSFMANCGASLHSHESGTKAGAMAMRQAIDGKLNEPEYLQAIKQWGLKP